MAERTIVYERVRDVLPVSRNPKDHDVTRIRGLVERFGFTNPVLRDERTGRLVAGHGRCRWPAVDWHPGRPPPAGVVTGGWS